MAARPLSRNEAIVIQARQKLIEMQAVRLRQIRSRGRRRREGRDPSPGEIPLRLPQEELDEFRAMVASGAVAGRLRRGDTDLIGNDLKLHLMEEDEKEKARREQILAERLRNPSSARRLLQTTQMIYDAIDLRRKRNPWQWHASLATADAKEKFAEWVQAALEDKCEREPRAKKLHHSELLRERAAFTAHCVARNPKLVPADDAETVEELIYDYFTSLPESFAESRRPRHRQKLARILNEQGGETLALAHAIHKATMRS